MPTRRQLLASLAALGAGAATAGCTGGGPEPTETDEDTLVLRIWDERAVAPYEESLAAFTKDTGVAVTVEMIEWDQYWQTLPQDMATGSAADVCWMNTANLVPLQRAGSLVDAGAAAGEAVGRWERVATDLYRRDDVLWGVPQLWDVTMLAANRSLVDAAQVDPQGLVFDPSGGGDTLREAARALSGAAAGSGSDAVAENPVYGFSAHADRTAVLGPFVAANGGQWQHQDAFAFASPQGIAAIQYLADLANVDLVAPPGPETNADPQMCRDLFAAGRLALLQTGTYDLARLVDGIGDAFAWDLHPPVAGPQGRRPLVHAIAAVGVASDDEDRAERIAALLAWLGGVEGQRPLAEAGLGIPAHTDLRGTWQEQWAGRGVDVAPVLADLSQVALPEIGARADAGTAAAMPVIQEVFAGKAEAAEALPRAQAAANDAAA